MNEKWSTAKQTTHITVPRFRFAALLCEGRRLSCPSRPMAIRTAWAPMARRLRSHAFRMYSMNSVYILTQFPLSSRGENANGVKVLRAWEHKEGFRLSKNL